MIARKPKMCGECNAEYRGFLRDSIKMVRLRIAALQAEADKIEVVLKEETK